MGSLDCFATLWSSVCEWHYWKGGLEVSRVELKCTTIGKVVFKGGSTAKSPGNVLLFYRSGFQVFAEGLKVWCSLFRKDKGCCMYEGI